MLGFCTEGGADGAGAGAGVDTGAAGDGAGDDCDGDGAGAGADGAGDDVDESGDVPDVVILIVSLGSNVGGSWCSLRMHLKQAYAVSRFLESQWGK